MANSKYFNGKDVVLVSSSNYNMHTKNVVNAQILAEELAARGVKVVFVESLGLKDVPLVGKTDVVKVFKRASDFVKLIFKGTRTEKKNIEILSLARIPFEKIPVIKWLNKQLITHYVKKFSLKKLGKKPILWLFLPTVDYLIDQIDHSVSIYHCVDDYSEVPGVDKKYILDSEKKTVKKVDFVFAVSKNTKERLARIDSEKEVIYINNVARSELYRKALQADVKIPQKMEGIVKEGKPVIGFMGNIASYKEDLGLLYEMAKLGSKYNFVLIGPVGSGEAGTDVSNLESLENVHLLGPIDYYQLYKYFKYFDVAIIARRMNKANEGGFPLKYFEYLASGLPVVVTDISSLHDFSRRKELGTIARNAREFVDAFDYWTKLEKENPQRDRKYREIRVDLAMKNSWTDRMIYLDSVVKRYLKKYDTI